MGGSLQEFLPYDRVCDVFIPTSIDTELIMTELSSEPGEERVCFDPFPGLGEKMTASQHVPGCDTEVFTTGGV
jgi:hypothetical protein